jgi:hypothetical protein
MAPGKRPDLYSSLDIAIMRAVMGEDFRRTLSHEQRSQWVDHINTYAQRDGTYTDNFNHSKLHTNGMVIEALGVLGGRQPRPVRLYDSFEAPHSVGPWLETIDWEHQWRASHLFWGGVHCFSMSSKATDVWLEAVFSWLNANLDETTGWWRKGVPHADRHQPLGGSVHILPIYEHHDRPFPYPERVIDSVLELQLPSGNWLDQDDATPVTYLDLDALYALRYMRILADSYRSDDIIRAVERYAGAVDEYWQTAGDALEETHPHFVLAAVGCFGLLNHFLPDRYPDDVQWSDIFSDRRLYQTRAVEHV